MGDPGDQLPTMVVLVVVFPALDSGRVDEAAAAAKISRGGQSTASSCRARDTRLHCETWVTSRPTASSEPAAATASERIRIRPFVELWPSFRCAAASSRSRQPPHSSRRYTSWWRRPFFSRGWRSWTRASTARRRLPGRRFADSTWIYGAPALPAACDGPTGFSYIDVAFVGLLDLVVDASSASVFQADDPAAHQLRRCDQDCGGNIFFAFSSACWILGCPRALTQPGRRTIGIRIRHPGGSR